MIGDYGLSKTQKELDDYRGAGFGTPGYLAPEMLNSKEPKSAKADIWAFACIAHLMFFGEKFWLESESSKMYYRLTYQEYEIPKTLPNGDKINPD